MADDRLVLICPGEGPPIDVDLDVDRLLRLVAAEIEPIVSRPMSARRLPPLKQSTVERKRRAGYAQPSQPLVGRGRLQRSHHIKTEGGSVVVYAAGSINVIPPRFWSGYLQLAEIDRAIERAMDRYMEGV